MIPTHIKTITASGDTTVSFVDGASSVVLDSTYDEYMFVCTDIGPATDEAYFTFNGSSDSGSNYNVTKTTTSFRAYHSEGGSGALGYDAANDHAQGTGFQYLTEYQANEADASAAGILHIFRPASTTYVTHFYSRFHYMQASDYAIQMFAAGYFNVTAALDAFQFKMSAGAFDGVIQLYGIA